MAAFDINYDQWSKYITNYLLPMYIAVPVRYFAIYTNIENPLILFFSLIFAIKCYQRGKTRELSVKHKHNINQRI